MLKKEDITKIAAILKVEDAKLLDAITSDAETALDIGTITSFTAQELELRDKNSKAAGYNEGKEAGEEMLVKGLKQKYGITVEGKDPVAFTEAFKSKLLADAKLEPSQQLKEKHDALERLQENYKVLEEEKNGLSKTIEQMVVKHQILAAIPSNKLSGEELIAVMNANGYTFDKGETGIIAKLNGATIRNQTTQAEAPISDVIAGFIADKGFAEGNQDKLGRGGKNDKTTITATTITGLKKKFEEDGKSVNSSEFQAACVEHAKNNANFYNE
jgi:hypothetical protein